MKERQKTALVTGANKGIGFEISQQLANRKIKVLIGARDEEKGMNARNRLRRDGCDAHYINIDVKNPSSIKSSIEHIDTKFKRLDILVNNAGILIDPQINYLELDLDTLNQTLVTNALGPMLLSQASVPLMKRNNFGRIVNMSSTLGSLTDMANPDSDYSEVLAPAYRLSKTLLNGLTILLANEVRGTNILVNSTCPGWVRTDMGGNEAPLSPTQGAETPVWLATLPDNGPTGGFFREKQPIAW
jgi:NAD(P)-dependent dehydrogenase (short-subunit alcohol dehydrogenase family)